MTKHIDQQRAELLARRDEILNLPTYGEDHEAELDELNAALGKLDEAAALGDDRPHPRLKIRRAHPALDPDDLDVPEGRPWVVSIRHAADDDVEQVLGFMPEQPVALAAAVEYVAVQRFLADRLAHPNGAGL